MKSICLLATVAAQPGLSALQQLALVLVAMALAYAFGASVRAVVTAARIADEERARLAGTSGDELGGSHEHTPVDSHPILDPRRTDRL